MLNGLGEERLLQQTCKTTGSEQINKLTAVWGYVNDCRSEALLNESYTSGCKHSLPCVFAVLLTFRRFGLGSVLASDRGQSGASAPQLRRPSREEVPCAPRRQRGPSGYSRKTDC
jgi:hypothetical protein